MTSLGFENYAEALKIYLSKYREVRPPDPVSTPARSPGPSLEQNRLTREQQQSQTNRNENQPNRPNSQGGFPGTGGPNQTSGSFAGGELGGQQEGGDGQYMAYGGQAGHNGASGDY